MSDFTRDWRRDARRDVRVFSTRDWTCDCNKNYANERSWMANHSALKFDVSICLLSAMWNMKWKKRWQSAINWLCSKIWSPLESNTNWLWEKGSKVWVLEKGGDWIGPRYVYRNYIVKVILLNTSTDSITTNVLKLQRKHYSRYALTVPNHWQLCYYMSYVDGLV